jgi:hypothetical protein
MDILGAGLANLASTALEMKEVLGDSKRNTESQVPNAPFASAESAENLLRAVSAELDHPVPPPAHDYQR